MCARSRAEIQRQRERIPERGFAARRVLLWEQRRVACHAGSSMTVIIDHWLPLGRRWFPAKKSVLRLARVCASRRAKEA